MDEVEKMKSFESDNAKWRDTFYGKQIFISRLIAEYNLFSTVIFPYTHCKLRVWQRDDDFLAITNIAIRDVENNTVDGTCGLGDTAMEAFNDCVANVLELIEFYENKWGRKLDDEDYEYSDPDDF